MSSVDVQTSTEITFTGGGQSCCWHTFLLFPEPLKMRFHIPWVCTLILISHIYVSFFQRSYIQKVRTYTLRQREKVFGLVEGSDELITYV